MTDEQAAQALKLLRSIASDIESMRGADDYFDGFSEWFIGVDDTARVEWPNLAITGRDIAAFLKTVKG